MCVCVGGRGQARGAGGCVQVCCWAGNTLWAEEGASLNQESEARSPLIILTGDLPARQAQGVAETLSPSRPAGPPLGLWAASSSPRAPSRLLTPPLDLSTCS